MSRRGAMAALVIAGVALAMWPAQSASAATDEWSTFHHDTMHTGVSSDTAVGAAQATSLSVKWSQPVGGGPVYASPVVANNLVYDVGVGGVVHAFTTTGASSWTSPVNIGSGAVASPAVDGNSLYIGSDNGVLTALDATNGNLQCTFALPIFAPETTPGRIEASPVVGHDSTGPVVYFGDTGQSEGTNHGREWAVYGVGNSKGACTLKWMHDLTHPGAKTTGSWSPPALVTDSLSRTLVVYGTGQPDDAVYALDASNGSQVWRFQTLQSFSDADVGAGPTISAPGVNGFSHGVVYIDGKDQIEYAIDLLTGAQLWQFDMKANSGHFSNSVSCAALVGNLVVVAYWKYVYAFNATTGVLVWRTAAGAATTLSSVSVSGAAGDQVVLRSDMAGSEFAFRLSDGALLKSLKIAATRFDASTAVADGMAFVAGEDGNLYALSEAPLGNPGSITGTVTNANTHALIQGATVKCSLCAPTTTTTDVNGKYMFPSAPPGSDSVTFSDTGYVSQTDVVAVTAGTQATQPAALVPDGSITGTVTDANTQALIQGATVTCSVCTPTTATTAADGTYTLLNAPPGNDSVTFSDTGYVPQTDVVAVTAGTQATQPAALTPGHQFIFSDGFESGSLAAWTSSAGLVAESTTAPHSGTYAAEGNVTGVPGDARETLPSTYTAGYERVWFNKTSSSTQVYLLQASTAADARVASVYVSTGGFLGLQAADNTYHLSATPVTNTGWHELELRFTIGTTGSADVWLDGKDVIPLSTVNLKATPVGVMQIGDQTSHTWHVFYDDAAFDTNMIP
jgi:outer membrane protein assembly factor BamB